MQLLINNKIRVVIAAIGALLVITIVGYYVWLPSTNALVQLPPRIPDSTYEGSPIDSIPVGSTSEKTVQTQSYVIVHIVGAVNKPGIYEIVEGSRLYEAVDMAGGFSEDADREAVNLAMVIHDGIRYNLPRVGEEVE